VQVAALPIKDLLINKCLITQEFISHAHKILHAMDNVVVVVVVVVVMALKENLFVVVDCCGSAISICGKKKYN
jgi:hypothetical protein